MYNSVDDIKDFLINNPEKIVELLENTNFYNVTYRRYCNQIRCSKTPESNKNGVEIYCDSLFGVIYSTGIRGDIFQIIMEHNNISFSELIKFIENFFNLERKFYSNKKPLFGGVYAKYSKKQDYKEVEEKEEEYDISILNNYRNLPSILFYNDGIDTNTQKKFHVCYDDNTSRICVPWFNENGKVVGIEGRINQTEIDEWVEEILHKNINIKKSKLELNKYINEHKMEISKKLLDCKKNNESYESVTWGTCSIRKWLNNEFKNSAFS